MPLTYPQGFPQRGIVWMNPVDNLWTMWISSRKACKLQHNSPVSMWITLWKLWMNPPLAVHNQFLQL